jgi:hypothetical protein
MEILLAVFTGMTAALLIGSWHGEGRTEESVEEEMITYSAFFLHVLKLI